MIKRKSIYVLLDIFLVLGALAVLATINGGQWISMFIKFYQSPEVSVVGGSMPVTSQGTGEVSTTESSAQAKPDCLITPLLIVPGWDQINGVISAYNGKGQGQGTATNTTLSCK